MKGEVLFDGEASSLGAGLVRVGAVEDDLRSEVACRRDLEPAGSPEA